MNEWYRNKILVGDSKLELLRLNNDSIDQVFTSPPYWGLRNYGTDHVEWGDGWKGELGSEPQPNQFIEHLMEVFDIVYHKLKITGSVWVNLGDTYIGGGNAQGHDKDTTNFGSKTNNKSYVSKPIARGKHIQIKDKSLTGIPDRFKIAMIDRGWICRTEWIWWKRNPLPSPHEDRGTIDYEKIFFFVKNNKPIYWFNTINGSMVSKQPLGTKGEENIDWERRRHKKCDGQGCRICNDLGWKRKTLWKSRDYFFEMQYEKFADGSLERYYREKIKGMSRRKGSKYHEFNGKANADFHRQYGAHDFYERKGKHLRATLKDFDVFTEDELLALMDNLLTDYKSEMKPNGSSVIDILVQGFAGSHFAIFPEKLVELVINMGCPDLICKKCHLPVQKYYKTESESGIEDYKGQSSDKYKKAKAQNPSETKRRILASMSKVIVKIGRTTCGCGVGYYNGIILDMFGGRGTVGKVAYSLNRDYSLIELNEKYVSIAKKYMGIGARKMRLSDML